MGRILTAALIVIGLSGLGMIAWVSLRDSSTPEVAAAAAAAAPAPPVTRAVLVAAGPLRAGNLIKPADLEEKTLPVDQIAFGASDSSPQTRSSLFGAMIRRSLAPGEVITPRRCHAARRSRLPCRRAAAGHARDDIGCGLAGIRRRSDLAR